MLLIATMIGVPIGFLAGVYLAEYGGAVFSSLVRFVTDLLNGVPSIVMGIFAYTLIVLRVKHFSAIAGGTALGIMMIPIAVRSTEEFLRAVTELVRSGGHWLKEVPRFVPVSKEKFPPNPVVAVNCRLVLDERALLNTGCGSGKICSGMAVP